MPLGLAAAAVMLLWIFARGGCRQAWAAARDQASRDLSCAAEKVSGGTQGDGCSVLRFEACGVPVTYHCRAREIAVRGVVLARLGYRCQGGAKRE